MRRAVEAPAVTIGPVLLQDPRPQEVQRALERVALRWGHLSLEQATAHAPAVRRFAHRCGRTTACEAIHPDLPDLGPAAALDQLHVAVFDACATHRTDRLSEGLKTLLAHLT